MQLSAQAFLTGSWSLSFKAEEVSTSTSARAAPNDRAKAPANNKLPRANFMMSSFSVGCPRLPVPAGSDHGTVLVKDATASPHSKARQILVRFHDTLPRRGPTRPTIGLTVISDYGGSFALLCLPTTVPSLIISRTFPPGGAVAAAHAPFSSLAEMHGMHLLPKPGDQPEWQFRQKLLPVIH